VFFAMTWVIYLAMFPLLILCFIMRMPGLIVLYNCLGLLFYSLFLIIDTMMICRSVEMEQKHGMGMAFGYDDYVLGALNLYLDIVMIFLYLLKIFGSRN
jgi:protein lifeguard